MPPVGPTTSDQPTFTLNKMTSFQKYRKYRIQVASNEFWVVLYKSHFLFLFLFVLFCFLFVCLFVCLTHLFFFFVFRTNGACN